MVNNIFYVHGKFCATHPWEVIVSSIALTFCMLFVDQQYLLPTASGPTQTYDCHNCFQDVDYVAADMIVMTIIRCLALLYSYYQFQELCKFKSVYIMVIAGLFAIFSSFVFTSAVVNFLKIELADLKDALFLFLLLTDISKAAGLAYCALAGRNQEEIVINIARGNLT